MVRGYDRHGRLVLIAPLAVGCSRPAARRDDVAPESHPAPRIEVSATTGDAPASARALLDASSDAPGVAIVDAPMGWSAEREKRTLEFRRVHSDRSATDISIEPRMIVLHFTGGSSAASTRAYFDNTKIEASRKALARGGAVNVSAHFVVDRDGTIYRLQPETRFARHCIGLNHVAIGIENVGDGARYPLTEAQVAADAALVRDLAARFPITHLLGHHEVMSFRDNPYYVELVPAYKNVKNDPGESFMSSVRARVADLGLAGLATAR
jgi:hypothetical protein